jgi:restriction system protein
MARRNRDGDIFDLLVLLPWWVSMAFAGVVYAVLRFVLPGLPVSNPFVLIITNGLQQSAGFLALLFLFPAPVSFFRSLHRRRLLDRQTGLDSIRAMSWQDFERLCGEAYRRKGFSVEEAGLGGADGGVDLVLRKGAETWLVQCKRWRNAKVGVKEIRELYGIVAAERAGRGVFITSGDYSPDARAFAVGKPLDLLDGAALLDLVREVQREPVAEASRREVVRPSLADRASVPPSCPRCGALMVLRTAKRGVNTGGQFWGCSAYPKCRGVVDL